jgi:hypothetical protein
MYLAPLLGSLTYFTVRMPYALLAQRRYDTGPPYVITVEPIGTDLVCITFVRYATAVLSGHA